SKLKAVQPGGASSPVLLPNNLDLPLDFDSVQQAGSILGTAGVMIFDQNVCMVRTALYYADFFPHESCRQCTPGREGTASAARRWDARGHRDPQGPARHHERHDHLPLVGLLDYVPAVGA